MNIKDSKIYTIIFTFVITFVFVVILALVNSFTREKVTINNELFKRKAILHAFGIRFSDDQSAYETFDKLIKRREKLKKYEVYDTRYDNSNLTAIIVQGQGLWGTVTAVVSCYENLERVRGIAFISHSETPGLGGRIEEAWFTDQFVDEKIVDNTIGLNVGASSNGDKDHDNGKFDAISGATRTSESIEKIINKSIEILKKL